MRELRQTLLVQFSVVSFVVLAATAVTIAIILSNRIRSDAIEHLVDEAVGTSAGRLLRAIDASDLETPMTGARYDRFHDFVQQSIVSQRTARVKVWAKDGTVIYSSDPASVGQRFPIKGTLLRALQGENGTAIRVPEDAENTSERDLGTLMEVYTPIVFPGAGEPQGAFEIYQYYAPTAERIGTLRRWVVGSLAAGFLVLWGSLVFVVGRGWRTIKRQQASIGVANHALETAKQQLEAELSERKKAEEAAARRAEQLACSNAELERFAYAASHDLQEPLRMVTGFVKLLERRYKGKLDAEADEFIAYAVDGAGRMRELIHDLLAYSRVGAQGKAFTPVDSSDAFSGAVANLHAAINDSGAAVTRGPLPKVQADLTHLTQLFQNLISNAIKFRGKDAPEVHVSAEPRAGEWLFCVRDNGIGIEPQHAERIFHAFERLHGRGEYPGTGIGLSICKKIVEGAGGRIWVESTPGEGSTFYFTLPAPEGAPP